MPRFWLVLLATLPALLWGASATAILIDDFTTSQSLVGPDEGAVAGGGVLGGERELTLSTSGAFFEAMQGTAAMGSPPGTQAAVLICDGSDDDGASGIDFLLGSADLTDGGLSDRFLLEVVAVAGVFDVFITVIEDETRFSRSSFSSPVSITTPRIVEIAFADLTVIGGAGADFASAEGVVIAFDSNGEGPDDFVTIASISTVPEPAAAGRIVCLVCVAGLRMLRQGTSRA